MGDARMVDGGAKAARVEIDDLDGVKENAVVVA